jgi:alpha,alpha-trehalase
MNKIIFFLIGLFFLSIKTFSQIKPWEAYPVLFHDVQMHQVFKDSKTFVDCVPRFHPDSIQRNYQLLKSLPDFSLDDFIRNNFSLPPSFIHYQSDTSLSVQEHINNLWDVLKRVSDSDTIKNSTLLPLPYGYIIPGGRFREVYYWDSYFTMLGLRESGRDSLVRSMVANFAWLIDTYGFIPNGNRTYYLSRSQPPFFSLMVSLLAEIDGDSVLPYYLPQLQKEYAFWMEGKESLTIGASKRLVHLGNGKYLNRYWDDSPAPRPEAYREDVLLQKTSQRNDTDIFVNIRAAAESGWDFSSRWLKDPDDLRSIHTTDIVPTDLNSLLYHLELTLAAAAKEAEKQSLAQKYKELARQRRELIIRYCQDPHSGWFRDYDFVGKKFTPVWSLAGVYPFFLNIAPKKSSHFLSSILKDKFLQQGGLATTLTDTKEQWDYPNGWAPLHFLSIMALQQYGDTELSELIAQRWLTLNERVFKSTGRMMEKYDVVKINRLAGGGEYPTQDGFGWTNGVYLFLFRKFKQ